MTYEHLVEKMQKEQAKFMPTIQKLEQEGTMPEDFAKAVAGIQAWNERAAMKLGDAEVAADAPDIDLVDAFSNALFTYQGMFSETERSAIETYREYAEEMYNKVKAGDTQPA